jgi:salicylate hydroxylase
LTAALALLKRGVDVEVYERSPALTEVGAGLHVSPNGTRVLIELGLGEAMTKLGVVPKQRDVRLWNTGQTWQLRGHGADATTRYGAPYLLMHRGDLHALLAEGVLAERPGAIHLKATCTGVRDDGTRVEALFEDGTTASGDLLVGADGVHSAVRRALFGGDNATFTGNVAWRGLVPAERVPQISPATTSNWIGPGGSVTVYGVRGGTLVNFVSMNASDTWTAESWTAAGTTAECLADFEGWHDDIRALVKSIDVPYKWGLFLHEPLTKWTSGRITLLGDACHAMLPFLGQGANSALEDGMVLARCLEGASDVAAALQTYDGARCERAATLVRKSAEQGARVRSRTLSDPESAARYVENQWSPASVAAWYDWIFEYNAVETLL